MSFHIQILEVSQKASFYHQLLREISLLLANTDNIEMSLAAAYGNNSFKDAFQFRT